MPGKEIFVAHTSELKEGERKIVPLDTTEIGLYRVKGKFYAYENLCPHQGGPACAGLLMPKVEEVIAPDKRYEGMQFDYEDLHIVCPWHAWAYELSTGEMVADRKFRLKKYEVIEKGEEIYVLA